MTTVPGTSQEAVAVKALKWNKRSARSVVGLYTLHDINATGDGDEYWQIRRDGKIIGDFGYPDQIGACVAAQADYEQRVRSALVASPPATEPVAFPDAFVDERGNVTATLDSRIPRLLAEMPKPPIGSKLLPLYAAPGASPASAGELTERAKRTAAFQTPDVTALLLDLAARIRG